MTNSQIYDTICIQGKGNQAKVKKKDLKNINFSDNNSNQLQELIKQIHILSNHKEEIERKDFYPTEEKPISYEERLNLIYNMKEIDDDRREFLIKKLNMEF